MLGRTFRRTFAAVLAAGALWAPGASAQSGGPVLVVNNSNDPFAGYYAEILRGEGLNEFAVADLSQLSPGLLSSYQVVLLTAQASVNGAQANALAGWMNAGGNLIAIRPNASVAGMLGLGTDTGDLAEGYLAIDTSSAPGAGITGGTMQYHGVADRWTLPGARQVAALYSNASAPAGAPAVTLRDVGGAGGQAAAFTYDLARSVVQTRQGNPAWAGQARVNADSVIRASDLFFPDWVDFSKIRVPQADEQQRLLANLIIQMNMDRMPLPRFWYLPRGEQAAVVMTGDDHAYAPQGSGTVNHLNRMRSRDPAGCSVADWGCVRGTSYLFSDIPAPWAAGFQAAGFEIAMHLNTGCANFTPASLAGNWSSQLAQFRPNVPGVGDPRTNRTHCIAWNDWVGEATAERVHGVRLDTNYYYWPGSWLQDRPGLFTGSGFPQRFADTNGALIDVYQAATQLTDESGQNLETHIRELIDGALEPTGYFGVFTANMHTDQEKFPHEGMDAIVNEAQFRGVPVVSAAQMLDWLDGRNGSSFRNLSYANQRLRFTVASGGPGARGLQGMLPAATAAGPLSSLTRNGVPVVAPARAVKGMNYAFFDAAGGGDYVATYGDPVPETAITGVSVSGTTARISFVSEPPSSTFQCRLDGGGFTSCASPREYRGLSKGTHTVQVRAIDSAGRVDPTPAEQAFTVGTLVRPGPKVKISPNRVRVSKDGTVRLRVRCPASQSKCRVKLKLRASRKNLAARTFLVRGGKNRVIELTLTRSTRASLTRKRTLRVTAVAVSRNPAGQRAVTRKTIRLVGR